MRAYTVLFAVAALFGSGALAADETASPERYTIKESDRSTRTLNAREIATSDIPFDKRYAELSREQQDLLKSQYELMGDDDEPPFPVKGLAGIFKAVSAGANKRLPNGDLVILVDIDSQGSAASAAVYASPDLALTKYVVAVLMRETYKPGICDGTPCAMVFPFRIKLTTRTR